jgi:flagellar biogenesis protein FliO
VIAALGGVVALFLGVVWLLRRSAGRGTAQLPGDVFEVLGRASLGNKQPVQLVRLGGKLLLVSLTGQGWQALTEIDDPDEVTRLTGLCRQAQPGSASDAFRRLLQHWGSGDASETPRRRFSRHSPPVARRAPTSPTEAGDA